MIDSFRRRAVEQAYLRDLAEQPEAEAPSPHAQLILIETLQALEALTRALPVTIRRHTRYWARVVAKR